MLGFRVAQCPSLAVVFLDSCMVSCTVTQPLHYYVIIRTQQLAICIARPFITTIVWFGLCRLQVSLLALSSARSCPSSILGHLSIVWLVSHVVISCRMASWWSRVRAIHCRTVSKLCHMSEAHPVGPSSQPVL